MLLRNRRSNHFFPQRCAVIKGLGERQSSYSGFSLSHMPPSEVSRHTTTTEAAVILINYLPLSFVSLVLTVLHYRPWLFQVDLLNEPIRCEYPARLSYIIESLVIHNFLLCLIACWLAYGGQKLKRRSKCWHYHREAPTVSANLKQQEL